MEFVYFARVLSI